MIAAVTAQLDLVAGICRLRCELGVQRCLVVVVEQPGADLVSTFPASGDRGGHRDAEQQSDDQTPDGPPGRPGPSSCAFADHSAPPSPAPWPRVGRSPPLIANVTANAKTANSAQKRTNAMPSIPAR